MGSRHVGFGSRGAPTLLSLGTWDRPRSRAKPVSPALAGRFMTSEPPGKPGGLAISCHVLCMDSHVHPFAFALFH